MSKNKWRQGQAVPFPYPDRISVHPSPSAINAAHAKSSTTPYHPVFVPPYRLLSNRTLSHCSIHTLATLMPVATSSMPQAIISNATRIWEVGVQWPLYAQCGVWDAKGRGVDIWECIRARKSCYPICPYHRLTGLLCRRIITRLPGLPYVSRFLHCR